MKRLLLGVAFFSIAAAAHAQIQVDLKFKRLQYIAYEPVLATVTITNLAGRDVELHDDGEQPWFGFEVTANEGRTLVPLPHQPEPPLRLAAGPAVTRKMNLTPRFPVTDLVVY